MKEQNRQAPDTKKIITILDPETTPELSGFRSFDSRVSEAISLAALMEEIVRPWALRQYPDNRCEFFSSHTCPKENFFDDTWLSKEAREGMAYIAMRIQDVLKECEQAFLRSPADEREVSQ